MTRSISPSEQRTLDCTWRHALAYTGVLTGGTVLRKKAVAPALRQGRAWGRAIGTVYEHTGRTDSLALGHQALDEALDEDVAEQREAGVLIQEDADAMRTRLHLMLDHHHLIVDPLDLRAAELELSVPIPSRSGRRSSNRYRFHGFLDGLHDDEHGTWIWEAKLRRQLTPLALLQLDPQLREYAYAAAVQFDVEPVGVIVEERLNEVPSSVKHNKNGSVSKVQSCTVDTYVAACEKAEHNPDSEVMDRLAAKQWFQRQRIFFRPGELEDTGRQLVAVARHVAALESGEIAPVRSPSRARCPGCPFFEVCNDVESDPELVDALYDRRPPKRLRGDEPVDVTPALPAIERTAA